MVAPGALWLHNETMSGAVKLPSELLDLARAEAKLMNRSITAQVEHWARIGRAIETSPTFSYDHVIDVLSGRAPYDALSAAEQQVALDGLDEYLQTLPPKPEMFDE